MQVELKALTPTAMDPVRTTEGAAGYDVFADADYFVHPGQRVAVKTGLSMALPDGFECQVRPRSGLALKHGITVVNAPGTIDQD